MELLLWRWSTTVQVTSLVMIAVFFWRLGGTVHTAAVRAWTRAWLANLAALCFTLVFWFFQPPLPVGRVIGGVYMGLKAAFTILLVQGAWAVRRGGGPLPVRDVVGSPRAVTLGLVGYTVAAAIFLPSIFQVGIVQHTVMAALLVAAGVALLAGLDGGTAWLAIGFLIRGALSFAEAAAYALVLLPLDVVPAWLAARANRFLPMTSSFDSGAEWLLALGCALAVADRVQRELRQANAELLGAQEDLRRLADRDVLTGLANRRALPEIFRAVQPAGAMLLFFDLDGFKQINDLHGHEAGDATLRRFASALRESFRPRDALVRYAGDEFVVVASGLDPTAVADRVAALRERVRLSSAEGPAVAFSVGMAELAPGGHPETALRRADEEMYVAKRGAGAATHPRETRTGA